MSVGSKIKNFFVYLKYNTQNHAKKDRKPKDSG
jgi:hypothetical protein